LAKCKYCGQSAGFFRYLHASCRDEHDRKEAERATHEAQITVKAARVAATLASMEKSPVLGGFAAPTIDEAANGDRDVIWRGITQWFDHLVREADMSGTAQESIETLVKSLLDYYEFKATDLPDGLWDRFVRLCACGDLDRGVLPKRVAVGGSLPFNLEAGETVVWLFSRTEYLEDKVVRSSTRGYGGVSIRVLPGLYAHAGQSAPMSITEGFMPIDVGLLAITDRAILFSGGHKSLRIKFKDIISFTRYDGGFAVCKGNQTARNQGFEIEDVLPGFPYVLTHGAARLWAEANTR
jgi:hypothetical protein